MKDSSIIGHVREAAEDFLRNADRPADQNLREFYRSRKYLGSKDRRQISEHYYGLIRSLRSILPRLSTQSFDRVIPPPEMVPPALAFRLCSYGLVDAESVQTGTGLSEEDLRLVIEAVNEEPASIEAENERLALEFGFPVWLVEKLTEDWAGETGQLLASLDAEAEVMLRFDPNRISFVEFQRQLTRVDGVEVRQSEWTPEGMIVTGRAPLNGVSALRRGDVVVQDIGSQMIGHVADPKPGMTLFDACAGAGGKSIHLIDLMGGKGRVVAHDANHSRLARLESRLHGINRPGIEIMFPNQFDRDRSGLDDSFDLVLLDVPCSATGTIRRNPGLKVSLVPDDVERAKRVQWEVLNDYASLVRPGGSIVYATCSLLSEENQRMIERFVSLDGSRFEVEAITPSDRIPAEMISDGYFRALPDRHGTDGFFAARLRRRSV